MENNSVFNVSFVSAYLSRKFTPSARVCEYPRATFKTVIAPAPLANVSTVTNYTKAEKEMIAEIAAEIGAEISDLYESADNEESDYRDMRESVAMSRIHELSDKAGEIADNRRAINGRIISHALKDSPIYSVACDLIEFFGYKKNVLIRINNTDYLDMYSVESNLGRGTDKCTMVGRFAIADKGYVFLPAVNGQLTMAVNFRTIADFYDAITPDEILNVSGVFPDRVNVIKSRNMKFRNTPKGAKSTNVSDITGNSASGNADKDIAQQEVKSNAALMAEAAKFGYFPLPSFQGEWKVTEEEKKTRASMKKRNQRAKAKAMEARDEKKIQIMEMIDAISKRNIAAKSSAKFSDAAIVPPKQESAPAFDIVEYFQRLAKEQEEHRNEAAKVRASLAESETKRNKRIAAKAKSA